MSIEAWIVICIVIALIVFFLLRPVNPSNKTDSQLLQSYKWAMKGGDFAANDRARIEEEMKRRGLLENGGGGAARIPTSSHFVQLSASRIRSAAQSAYDNAFKVTKEKGRDDSTCHQNGLTNILFSRLKDCDNTITHSEQVIKVIAMELLPFWGLPPARAKEAVCEYVVWREYPNLANERLIADAVHELTCVSRTTTE